MCVANRICQNRDNISINRASYVTYTITKPRQYLTREKVKLERENQSQILIR